MATTTAPTVIDFDVPDYIRNVYSGNKALSSNVGASFPVLSLRGSKWRTRYRKQEKVLEDNNNNPLASVVVVILASRSELSKTYYPDAFREGDDTRPICFSVDGVKPDPQSTIKQHHECATCRHNVWGSKITPQGNKSRACADNRRLVVVPAADLQNKAYDGPMLLRVPPTSLGALANYAKALDARQLQFHAVVTKVSFDTSKSYPLLTFQALGVLPPEKLQEVEELRDTHPNVAAILNTVEDMMSDEPSPTSIREAPREEPKTEPASESAPMMTAPQDELPVKRGRPKSNVTPLPEAKPKSRPAPVNGPVNGEAAGNGASAGFAAAAADEPSEAEQISTPVENPTVNAVLEELEGDDTLNEFLGSSFSKS